MCLLKKIKQAKKKKKIVVTPNAGQDAEKLDHSSIAVGM